MGNSNKKATSSKNAGSGGQVPTSREYSSPTSRALTIEEQIQSGKLAPRCLDEGPNGMECPICFVGYEDLNCMRCCSQQLCTECFVHLSTSKAKPRCPFCDGAYLLVRYSKAAKIEEGGGGGSGSSSGSCDRSNGDGYVTSSAGSRSDTGTPGAAAAPTPPTPPPARAPAVVPTSSVTDRLELEEEIRRQHRQARQMRSHTMAMYGGGGGGSSSSSDSGHYGGYGGHSVGYGGRSSSGSGSGRVAGTARGRATAAPAPAPARASMGYNFQNPYSEEPPQPPSQPHQQRQQAHPAVHSTSSGSRTSASTGHSSSSGSGSGSGGSSSSVSNPPRPPSNSFTPGRHGHSHGHGHGHGGSKRYYASSATTAGTAATTFADLDFDELLDAAPITAPVSSSTPAAAAASSAAQSTAVTPAPQATTTTTTTTASPTPAQAAAATTPASAAVLDDDEADILEELMLMEAIKLSNTCAAPGSTGHNFRSSPDVDSCKISSSSSSSSSSGSSSSGNSGVDNRGRTVTSPVVNGTSASRPGTLGALSLVVPPASGSATSEPSSSSSLGSSSSSSDLWRAPRSAPAPGLAGTATAAGTSSAFGSSPQPGVKSKRILSASIPVVCSSSLAASMISSQQQAPQGAPGSPRGRSDSHSSRSTAAGKEYSSDDSGHSFHSRHSHGAADHMRHRESRLRDRDRDRHSDRGREKDSKGKKKRGSWSASTASADASAASSPSPSLSGAAAEGGNSGAGKSSSRLRSSSYNDHGFAHSHKGTSSSSSSSSGTSAQVTGIGIDTELADGEDSGEVEDAAHGANKASRGRAAALTAVSSPSRTGSTEPSMGRSSDASLSQLRPSLTSTDGASPGPYSHADESTATGRDSEAFISEESGSEDDAQGEAAEMADVELRKRRHERSRELGVDLHLPADTNSAGGAAARMPSLSAEREVRQHSPRTHVSPRSHNSPLGGSFSPKSLPSPNNQSAQAQPSPRNQQMSPLLQPVTEFSDWVGRATSGSSPSPTNGRGSGGDAGRSGSGTALDISTAIADSDTSPNPDKPRSNPEEGEDEEGVYNPELNSSFDRSNSVPTGAQSSLWRTDTGDSDVFTQINVDGEGDAAGGAAANGGKGVEVSCAAAPPPQHPHASSMTIERRVAVTRQQPPLHSQAQAQASTGQLSRTSTAGASGLSRGSTGLSLTYSLGDADEDIAPIDGLLDEESAEDEDEDEDEDEEAGVPGAGRDFFSHRQKEA